MALETIQCPCNTCGVETEHEKNIISQYNGVDLDNDPFDLIVSAVCCRGCKTAAIYEERHSLGQIIIDYKPPRLWVQQPKWIDGLIIDYSNLYGLLREVYSAANDEQFRLLAMGVRATLDHVMTHILGDIGGFEQKLNQMVEKGHISQTQKEMLSIVIDAGSATAHRGFKPPNDLLRQMVAVMEVIIQQYYIAGPMLKTLQGMIPPRPPRPQKS